MNTEQYARWFRASTPYIRAHRGRTFVVTLGGEAIAHGNLINIVHDLALLHVLGVRLVVVHGARPQIDEALPASRFHVHRGIARRLTDREAMRIIAGIHGGLRMTLEALFSTGLPTSPLHNTEIQLVTGNFVVAQPIGVLDGVDHGLAGRPRRIRADGIHRSLDAGAIVLLSPMGYSPSGQPFNLAADDLAEKVALAIGADKLIAFDELRYLKNADGKRLANSTPEEVWQMLGQRPSDRTFQLEASDQFAEQGHSEKVAESGELGRSPQYTEYAQFGTSVRSGDSGRSRDDHRKRNNHNTDGAPRDLSNVSGDPTSPVHRTERWVGAISQHSGAAPVGDATRRNLRALLGAVRGGVPSGQLVSYRDDGALLAELFTAEGVGTQITTDDRRAVRRATPEDVADIVAIIRPLEESGVLVRRSRDRLERELDTFLVAEVDGIVAGCCALLPTGKVAELACVAVHPAHRDRASGIGRKLLAAAEAAAREGGCESLFALTTQARDWFVENGFQEVGSDRLPQAQRAPHNRERNAKVLIKSLV